MGLRSKPTGKKTVASSTGPTALSAKQRALLEEEQKLKAKMQRFQQFVEKAPQIAEEREQALREERRKKAAMTHRNGGSLSLIDRKTALEANVVPVPSRRTRAERRQGRLMFFVLLLALAGSVYYLYFTVTHH